MKENEFEVIDVTEEEHANVFKVEIELPNRKRRFFSFPKGDGWEEEINGIPNYINSIKQKLGQEQKQKIDFDITKAQKAKGKKYKTIEPIAKTKIKEPIEASSKNEGAK